MNLNNFSLRWLTTLNALAVVLGFLMFYLTFKYFWSHDREVAQVLQLQQAELQRVETLLSLERKAMGASLADYAAWDEMADFIAKPTLEFTQSNIGEHAFSSQFLDGVFIYDPDGNLVWGKKYDAATGQTSSYEHLLPDFSRILQQATRLSVNEISTSVRYMVVEDEPYLAATSRVCDSDGKGCNKGFLIFIKKVRAQFANVVEQATGVDIEVLTCKNDAPLPQDEVDVSYIKQLDYSGNSSVLFKINHHIKHPPFIRTEEILALLFFSLVMYLVNLWVVIALIKPITTASQVLQQFKTSGGKMPDASTFISSEMKEFATTINRIVGQLEDSQQVLRWQSEHDPLTRISNRRHLEKQLKSYLSDRPQAYLVLFLVDIDFFKRFNDSFGHLAGDEALCSVADVLQSVEFHGEKIVARFGGEEFCVVLASDCAFDAEQYAQQMRSKIEQLAIANPVDALCQYLTVSIGGVYAISPKMESYLSLFHQADMALYHAKEHGRDRYVVRNFV
ncbi:diguanylate cyclase [Vibrio cholerae]|uniref:diguanylate cyclase n=1 Tax=Vibrio cholerae TaxID=666 RepID=UPI00155E6825|nr:diguanylate cyclase [Vibrio cholerae]EGQ9853534.1 diguanylate cyclase [Vibrio cholerae]EGQ9854732.1 diguanylate cyclase [Vibrio cholerae]NOE56979.1 diguanylate cyclase [Vibrio cholerae]